MQGRGPDAPKNDVRLRLAIEAAAECDRHALSYLWARFADDMVLALVADGVDEGGARTMARSAFTPEVIANCGDRRDVLQCLHDEVRSLSVHQS
jgi:hypothetical protein